MSTMPPVMPIELPAPTKWPTAIGVIGIIVASLGIVFSACCGLGLPFYMPAMVELMKQDPNMTQEKIDATMASIPPAAYMVPMSLLGLGISILLMVGSIGLLRRREKAVKLLKIWAWTDLAYSLAGLPIQFMFGMRGTQYPGASPADMVGPISGLCCGGLLGLAFPVFVLIWLSRQASKDEILAWAERRQEVI